MKEVNFWWRLWYQERGIIAWILCHLNLHAWRYDVSGYSLEEYKTCGRCLKYGGAWKDAK